MKPIFAIFNDVHIDVNNQDDILRASNYMIKKCVQDEVDTLILAGDLFENRFNQRLSVLNTFEKMLNNFHKANLTCYIIAGNHDKTDYLSYSSFLDSFKYHPCVKFISDIEVHQIKGKSVTFLPFFDDEMIVPKINCAKGSDILVSHFELFGSSNLGNISKKETITPKMLDKWKKTFLGHFHNTQEVTPKIIHLPSFIQGNFGEDSLKGFTYIYEDLSYEIQKGLFKEFLKIEIDVNKSSKKDIEKLVSLHNKSKDTVRFILSGSEDVLKTFDTSIFKETEIDYKLLYEEIADSIKEEVKIINSYDKDLINDYFETFCKEKHLSLSEGKIILENFFNKKISL